ncbi:MAG: ATP-binding protein [Thermodesulfobacteriota bacterium]|nr:ATP-binding protein [Thermodesulfobacteriota bacterium]
MPDGGDITIQTKETVAILGVNRSGGTLLSARRKDDPPDSDYSNLRSGYEIDSIYQVAREPVQCVIMKISDTGSGIQKKDISKVFDPFFTTKPPGKGTGLGLATCLRIVESFKGEVHVESQEGKGSCFQILLPVSNA